MGFFESLLRYIMSASPYLLFGFIVAGFIKALVPDKTVTKWMGGKNFFSIIRASLIGIPLPMCSCSVVPTAVSLRKSGAGVPATSSFLISTPESGIDSIAMTYGLMDLPMTVFRPLAAFLTAFVAGSLQYVFNRDLPLPTENVHSCCCCHESEEQMDSHEEEESCNCQEHVRKRGFWGKVRGGLFYAFFDLIEDISLWLFIGLLAGGLIEYLVPADLFVGMNNVWGKIVILGIGIPLYICASASTPIAASLIMKGLSPGSAILFLLVGPATNISNILVLQKYIGKKGVLINILSISVVALLVSFFVDWFYGYLQIPIDFKIAHHNHEGSMNWMGAISSVILMSFLIRGIWVREIRPRLMK